MRSQPSFTRTNSSILAIIRNVSLIHSTRSKCLPAQTFSKVVRPPDEQRPARQMTVSFSKARARPGRQGRRLSPPRLHLLCIRMSARPPGGSPSPPSVATQALVQHSGVPTIVLITARTSEEGRVMAHAGHQNDRVGQQCRDCADEDVAVLEIRVWRGRHPRPNSSRRRSRLKSLSLIKIIPCSITNPLPLR